MKITRLSLYAFFALFLLVASCGKDGGETDPDNKPTSKTQAERVKDLQNSILLGISISDLKKEGYTLEEFLLAEVLLEDILTAGFTLGELLEEDDITIEELKSNGITLQQFYDANVPVGDLWEVDYTVNELLAIDGIGITDLKAANVPLQAILDAGQTVQAVLAGGFTVNDLKSGGVPVTSVYAAGVSLENMMSGGYTMVEILSLDEVKLKDFVDEGYTLEDFVEEGVSVDDLWGAGYSILEMYEANVPLIDIFGLGVGVGTLREFGATENELKAASLTGSVNDIDNNNYSWVRIGDQIWMSENLKSTRDNEGNSVFTYIYNDSLDLKNTYGRLYPVNTMPTSKLCPTSWHIPTYQDWITLIDFLGPDLEIKLKEEGSTYWREDNGTNSSGFSARGGGGYTGWHFSGIMVGVYYGVSDRYNSFFRSLYIGETYEAGIQALSDQQYTYVRCIKDSE